MSFISSVKYPYSVVHVNVTFVSDCGIAVSMLIWPPEYGLLDMYILKLDFLEWSTLCINKFLYREKLVIIVLFTVLVNNPFW